VQGRVFNNEARSTLTVDLYIHYLHSQKITSKYNSYYVEYCYILFPSFMCVYVCLCVNVCVRVCVCTCDFECLIDWSDHG
jgi:hypothetical protein